MFSSLRECNFEERIFNSFLLETSYRIGFIIHVASRIYRCWTVCLSINEFSFKTDCDECIIMPLSAHERRNSD